MAGSSSASSADHGGSSPVVPQSQKQASSAPSSSSAEQGRKRRERKGKAPFSSASGGSGRSSGKQEGAGKKSFRWGAASVACWGLPVCVLEALAGYWSRVLVAVRPEGWVLHPLQGLSSSPRSHPDIVSDESGRISSVTGSAPGGRDVVQGCLGNRPRSGSWLLQLFFSRGQGDRGGWLASHDRPLSPERVCSAHSVQDGDCSLRASHRLRGGFLSFHRSEGGVFPDTHSSVIEEAIEVPVEGGGGGGSLPVQGLCFGLSTAPQVFTWVFAAVSAWAYSHGIRLLRYLDDWLVLTSSETVAKKNVQDPLSLCHSLGIVINVEK